MLYATCIIRADSLCYRLEFVQHCPNAWKRRQFQLFCGCIQKLGIIFRTFPEFLGPKFSKYFEFDLVFGDCHNTAPWKQDL